MLDLTAIERLATRYQTTEVNVAREYCQHLFLSALYQQPAATAVLFKGGTALRIIYGSPRFSEDLDFSGFGVRQPAVEALIAEALGAVERVGLELEIEEAKATSGGYLGIIRARFLAYDVAMQVEVSLRARGAQRPETALIAGDFLPAYTLLHLPQEQLVREKVQALLTRGKARDFYDAYFLLRKGLVPPRDRHLLRQVSSRLRRLKPAMFQELRVFLPRSQHGLVKDFPAVLQRELAPYR